jgi:multimeric flavodoxin WrbA
MRLLNVQPDLDTRNKGVNTRLFKLKRENIVACVKEDHQKNTRARREMAEFSFPLDLLK